ncbi:MAG: AIR synthase-related protein [Candidatus Aenigmarchaeota archaeon]|nr:AIR synthase-related protein [Candidatus Aenigmarchaeota archaeon]
MAIRYSDYVDYDALDPVKRLAMEIFEPTLSYPERLGIRIVPESLGGTAPVFDFSGLKEKDFGLAHIEEGLGTKINVANTIHEKKKELSEKARIADFFQDAEYYRGIGTDNVRMAENDLVATGADPFSYINLIACGDSKWYTEDKMGRVKQLLWGMRDAADEGLFAIPGGETPELRDIVFPQTLDLAGTAVGLVSPLSRYLSENKLRAGDVIYGIFTPGPHSNGISKIRKIADKLKDGYFTKMDNGRMLGEDVLIPTHGYSRPTNECFSEGVDIHFAQPITGHGWKKIARAKKPFNYEIEYVPEPPPVFSNLIEFGKEAGGFDLSDKENYYAWNMGIGWVIMAPASEGSKISQIFSKYGKHVYELGKVVPGEKIVDMRPFGFHYEG